MMKTNGAVVRVAQPIPLSWSEARAILKDVMEKYMKRPLPVVKYDSSSNRSGSSAWVSWFRFDMDFYAGALPVAVALFVLSIASLETRKSGVNSSGLNASASLSVYQAQVVASTLLLAATIFSMLLVKRRQYTFSRDCDVSKRTTIAKFVKATKEQAEGLIEMTRKDESYLSQSDSTVLGNHQRHHSGTSRTDIYPAYRRTDLVNEQGAFWHRVPTLLLVKGDFVALQVGDVAPTRCKLMSARDHGKGTATAVEVHGGERITIESFGDARPSPTSDFPRGKSTVPQHSCQLLELCNNMSVFVLEETPLESFLNLPHAKQRLPLVYRQLIAIRGVMYCFAIFICVITLAVIFIRPGATSSDLSVVLHAPFLAALAVLPVATPVYLICLEVIGTSRILMKVHPHAYMRVEESVDKFQTLLFLRYLRATTSARLFLQGLRTKGPRSVRWLFSVCGSSDTFGEDEACNFGDQSTQLVRVPSASTYLLEKLGVATAFTLVDDELACEPYSIPQQLLIPSSKGLKLLDLCPTYDSDSDGDSEDLLKTTGRKHGRSSGSSPGGSDSDSDNEQRHSSIVISRKHIRDIRRRRRKRNMKSSNIEEETSPQELPTSGETEVQFEDPLWWHYLPSLKCIGLASLLIDDRCKDESVPIRASVHDASSSSGQAEYDAKNNAPSFTPALATVERALVQHVCTERERPQLQSLARCIGFNTRANSIGSRGDISFFTEKLRVNVVSTKLMTERLVIDAHALGLEESRAWGLLQTDSSSIVVEDARSKAYQLLTVGDPRVVTGLCHEAWQGENSTILPLNAKDRQFILETSRNWALSDLDVAAFAYSPVPRTIETRLKGAAKESEFVRRLYMVQNASNAPSKDPVSEDWALVSKQIFLGVMGSSVIPRKEIERLLETFDEAGVRLVYFSPRNMRRTKELASQIGIDVAWNCAISLRELDEGEEDPHRMVSSYADWTINAKLPHGIVNVRKHLEDVDNVPLLVSLFTDVTKESTMEMIKTFQDYHDTVVTMGLSHLPRNAGIFSTADISVGANVLAEELAAIPVSSKDPTTADTLLSYEVEFVARISAHSCAFNLRGAASSSWMPHIIQRARASLEAAAGAARFILFGSVSYSVYVFSCMCSACTAVPFVPTLGSVFYMLVVLPLVSLGLAMSDSDKESMHRVPPKNDPSITFSRKEVARLYGNTLFKALLPTVLLYILYLIAFGQLMIKFEPTLLMEECSVTESDVAQRRWIALIRCESLKSYSGVARTSAGVLLLAELVLCVIIGSASFVHTVSIVRMPPWHSNRFWLFTCLLSIALVAVYLAVACETGSFSALSWSFFLLAACSPFLCLLGNEVIKRSEGKHLERDAKLRRLQFETRLGMWSPK